MRVFISWSGKRSEAVAQALSHWLPHMITSVRPWLSSDDIEKGARWNSEIAVQLRDSQIGIICLTEENLNAPWILFEAGAISKSLEGARVCTFLFGIKPSDVGQPLGQFQATRATKEDTRKLVFSINRALGEDKVEDDVLENIFNQWWPFLERDLRAIQPPVDAHRASAKLERTEREMLEEILGYIRAQERRVAWSGALDSDVANYIDSVSQTLSERRVAVLDASLISDDDLN